MAFLAGQVLTAAALNLATQRRLARGVRPTASTATSGTTAQGVLRLDDVPVLAGRLYTVGYTVHVDGNVPADAVETTIYYTTDGSTPTVASAELDGARADFDQVDAAIGNTSTHVTDYTPAGDETLSLLLALKRIQGTGVFTAGTTGWTTRLWLDDEGEDPGDTGTDI